MATADAGLGALIDPIACAANRLFGTIRSVSCNAREYAACCTGKTFGNQRSDNPIILICLPSVGSARCVARRNE